MRCLRIARGSDGWFATLSKRLGQKIVNRVVAFVLCVVPTLISGCSVQESTRLESQRLVEVVHSEIFGAGNLELVERIYSPDFVGYLPEGIARGNVAMKEHVVTLRTAFPDWTEEIEEIAIDGDLIVTRFTSRGTNLGTFMGRAATGNRVEITEVAFYRIHDGHIVEQRVFPDMLAMQRQLGFIQ